MASSFVVQQEQAEGACPKFCAWHGDLLGGGLGRQLGNQGAPDQGGGEREVSNQAGHGVNNLIENDSHGTRV
jgi:hypothetical protein